METKAITYGSLFSGVGGFDLGFDNAGMKCKWRVEKDKYCRMVLQYHDNETEIFKNVKEVGKHNLKPVDIICGGFPCQNLSVAGKRKGLVGSRSGLWFEFARIIIELKPPWVVIENVPGLFSSAKGSDFAVIIRWLVECGYCVSYRCLNSEYWGVAQRRRRVFIVASIGNANCVEVLFESEGLPWNPKKGKKTRQEITGTLEARTKSGGFGSSVDNLGLSVADICGTLTNRDYKGADNFCAEEDKLIPEIAGSLGNRMRDDLDSHGAYIPEIICSATETGAGFWSDGKPRLRSTTAPSQPQTIIAFQSKASSQDSMNPTDKVPALLVGKAAGSAVCFQQNMSVRRLTHMECERLQGFPDDYTKYGMDENGNIIEMSDTQRYRQMGNAVTVSVAEWIGKRILMVENNTNTLI